MLRRTNPEQDLQPVLRMEIVHRMFKGVFPIDRRSAARDLVSGVVLAAMEFPQLLGYARIAGMPPVTGLFTAILPIVAFAIFGASRNLVVAADSATATILASKVSKLAAPYSAEYIALAGMTALLVAAMLLAARIFRLGFLADFLSRTVLIGFLAGVGVQVGIAMLGEMLGIPVSSSLSLVQLYDIATRLSAISLPAFLVSSVSLVAILFFRKKRPHYPVALLVVAASVILSKYLHFSKYGMNLIGPIQGAMPQIHLIRMNLMQAIDLIQVAASCVVVIIAQSAATSRVFADRYGNKVDDDADLLGLAVANFAAAFSGAFVVNGSPTQTAIAEQAGARSQIAQLSAACALVVTLLFLSGWLQYLPKCVLASVVFSISIGLVAIGQLQAIRKESPGEFTLALTTAIAVIVFGVEIGIFFAIVFSLLRHVRHSYRPHTMILVPNSHGFWEPVPSANGLESLPGLIIYRFGADLFYANQRLFVEEIRRLVEHAPAPAKWVIVDASAIMDLDYSAGRSVNALCLELKQAGVKVLFARVNRYLQEDMARHGVTAIIGEEAIHRSLHEALSGIPGLPIPQRGEMNHDADSAPFPIT